MEPAIIECVPNFSEGRDMNKIQAIADSIASVPGSEILNIDSGEAANRTVITFKGAPEAVVEAAFRSVRTAAEVIDMRQHKGEHPRIGATDVLPLVPISGISLEECAALARSLAERIFSELGIPCYCYEAAALKPERRKLEVCRRGEYEALPEKIADPDSRPDFSPETFTGTAARSGATVVGARNFLIAVNFNLDSKSAGLASEIAADVRESGRTVTGPDGTRRKIPGTLKGCKAIGWYIEEYGIAQVSMNITDISETPLHKAYCEVSRAALERGTKVTGTEIIGLVPRKCLLDAGTYFLMKENLNGNKGVNIAPAPEENLLKKAVDAMGLEDLRPFDLDTRLI